MSTDPSQWIKASASGGSGGDCVEMRRPAATVEVRDTKAHGVGPSLHLTPAAFSAWLDAAKQGTLDHLA